MHDFDSKPLMQGILLNHDRPSQSVRFFEPIQPLARRIAPHETISLLKILLLVFDLSLKDMTYRGKALSIEP